MQRFFFVIAFAALGLFNYAQYQGWSLFADDAGAQQLRSANSARALHK